MSVLHSRILAHGAGGNSAAAVSLPAGTAATPMTMPVNEHVYADNQAIYGQAVPLVTADGAVVAGRTQAAATHPWVAPVVPAGRP